MGIYDHLHFVKHDNMICKKTGLRIMQSKNKSYLPLWSVIVFIPYLTDLYSKFEMAIFSSFVKKEQTSVFFRVLRREEARCEL